MAVLHNLRDAAAVQSHAYIDTPEFAYDQWLAANPGGIGSVSNNPYVAIIGGGASGLCAAYELARAGCSAMVFEQAKQVGGRCSSHKFPGTFDIAEMGSMRFPPSEFILDHYLRTLGIVPGGLANEPDFPDPGKVPTYVCYGGNTVKWTNPKVPPTGFEKVNKGWNAFVDSGLSPKPGSSAPTLQPAGTITQALVNNDVAAATTYWQQYLSAFGQVSFYEALYQIFTGSGGWNIPGGVAWTFDDFDKFGALGVGSGGFGPLYPISFCEIFRLMVDELETSQKFLKPSSTLKDGIRTLSEVFAQQPLGSMGGVFLNTAVTSITGNISSGFTIHSASGTWPASRVIVATTTRAMELKLGLTKYGANAFIAPAVAQAIMRTHVVSSNKVAAQIIKFWPGLSQFRCLQTDGAAHQVYTLDYGVPGSAVCFMTYVWDDDAVKQQSITDGAPTGQSGNETIYKYLYSTIQAIGGEVANWAQGLRPLPNPNNPSGPPDYRDNVVFEEWQSSPYFGGAFKLSEPGQDQYVHDMFFDYQKAGTSRDTGLYIAGDCLAWTSGWVEGALTTGLNAAAAVLTSLGGTLNTDPRGKTPMSINAKRYNYFG